MVVATSTAILGAAALGTAATLHATGKAQKAAKNAAAQNAQTIDKTQQQNTALLAPYVGAGTKATDAIEGFLGLNGATDQDAAFQRWRDSTGYQFTRDQGLDAINSNLALKGQLKSGTAMKAAQTYGTNLANQFGQQYLGNLQHQQGVGLSAAGANVNANSNSAGMSVGNNNMLAGQIGNSAMQGANAFNNLLSNATSAYGLGQAQKTDSSYQNAFTIKPQADDGGYTPYSSMRAYR